MDVSWICSFFEHLPRQGPGSFACTQKMFSLLPAHPAHPKILDIECGSGMQTIDLARLPALEKMYRDNPEAQGLIAGIQQEIHLHREHSQEYGYQFILLQNSA